MERERAGVTLGVPERWNGRRDACARVDREPGSARAEEKRRHPPPNPGRAGRRAGMEGDENVFDSSPRRNLIPARAGTTTTMTTPPTKPKPTRASPGSGAAVGAKKMSNVPAVKSVHVGPLWTHWEEQLACSRADVYEMRTARDAATRAKD